MKKLDWYWVGIIWVFVLVLYGGVLGTYFGGDDFFHFKVALRQAQGKLGILSAFGFYPFSLRGIAFYRPLFREAIYNLFYGWFGLNVLPFRLTQMALQFGNIALVYVLAKKLLGSVRVAFFSALFFGLSAANVGVLYYLAGGIQAQGATFFGLLAVYFYSKERKEIAFGSYLLALASHEMAIGIPVVLMGWKCVECKKFVWREYLGFTPYFLVLGIYLYLNFFVIGLSSGEEQYGMVLSMPKLINTLGWYGAWSLGLPEMTVDFVRSGLRLDPRLMSMWGRYYVVVWPAFIGSGLAITRTGTKHWRKLVSKKMLFLVGWFVVGILPVLFLPIHKKTYYLALSLAGFWMGVGQVTRNIKGKLFWVLVGLLLILNVTSVKLAEKTYWAINRARVAEKLLTDFEQENPDFEGRVIYVRNDPEYEIFSQEWGGTSKQAFFALSGPDAWQLKYNNFDLEVFYEDIDEDVVGDGVAFVARLN